MADDMLIGVGVKADFSSLKTESKASADALRTAQANWKEAFDQLGAAAQGGSAQAIAALKQYETELAEAQARASSVGAVFATTQAEAGAAASHTVPQYAAASAAIRTLEGGMTNNVRAAERFIATTLGLGPILQTAFPVIGAIAFSGVLVSVIERIGKFASDAEALGNELGVGWLDGAVAQLTGMGEAVKQIDEHLTTLARDNDHIAEKQLRDAVELETVTKGRAAGLALEASQLDLQIGKQKQMLADDQQALSLKQQQLAADKEAASQPDSAEVDQVLLAGHTKETDEDGKLVENAQNNLNELTAKYRILTLEAAKAAAAEAGKPAGRGGNEDDERLRAMKTELEERKSQRDLSTKEEFQFWQDRIAQLKQGSAQYLQVLTEMNRLAKEGAKQGHEALKAAEADKGEPGRQDIGAALAQQQMADIQKALQQTGAEWNAYKAAVADASVVQAENNQKQVDARVAFELATGKITEQQAANERAAAQAEVYRAKLQALREELERLKAEGTYDPFSGKNIDPENATKQQGVQNQIDSTEGSLGALNTKTATKEAGKYKDIWKGALQEVGREFSSIQTQMLRGQISFTTAAERLTAQVANAALLAGEREIMGLLHKKAMAIAAKVEEEEAKTAATVTGASTRDTVEAAAAAKSGLKDAKSAAKGAYAATVHIPIIGPVLAPIAAASAFAAVAAFEQGGVAQITGPAYLHAGERVLNAKQTGTFDYVMNNAIKASGKSTTLNFGNSTFHGVADQKTFAQLVKKNNRDVAKSVQRALRNGHLG